VVGDPGDGAGEAFLQVDGGGPAEEVAGFGVVGEEAEDFGVGGAEAGGILADGEVGFVEDAEDGFGYLTYGYFGAGSEVEFLT